MTRLDDVAVGGKVLASVENADRDGINRTKQLMVPASVSAGSIGTYGAVTFSGVSSISLDECFTSEFDWYEVRFNITTASSATLQGFLRLAGTDSSSGYDTQRTTAINATVAATQSLNAANWVLDSIGMAGGIHSGTINLFGPALAAATTGDVASTITPNPMTTSAGRYWGGLLHRATTTYDGLTITPGAGNISGTIRVYGII